jgi:hypothetical protein
MSESKAISEDVYLIDTITKLQDHHRDKVTVSGSHGGIYAGYCAAKMHVRAVILNDAGIGKDRAGIGSLDFLEGIELAAATVDSRSCRIADAGDMWARGVISHVNQAAGRVGCRPGQTSLECAELLRVARPLSLSPPVVREARFIVKARAGERKVIGIDSASLFQPEDVGQIVVTGSHGGLVGGDPATLIMPKVHAAFYNDAGGCRDDSGFTRLPVLDQRGIAAATVSNETARIGDAMSAYTDGIVSRVNATATRWGGRVGMRLAEFIELLNSEQCAGTEKT